MDKNQDNKQLKKSLTAVNGWAISTGDGGGV